MFFWLNGAFRDGADEGAAAIDIADRGFLLGDGVFETILLVDGAPAFLSAHLRRMRAGAAGIGISANIDETEVAGVLAELVRRNDAGAGLASARLTLTRGAGPRGLVIEKNVATSTFLVTVSAYGPPKEAAAPAALIVSSHRRNELSAASRWKTLNYLDNVLARAEAAAVGADDAVMLNSTGRAACASAANIFVIRDGQVTTPPLSEGALPGVVRGALLEGAKAAGIVIEQAPVEAAALEGATLLLANSLIGLRPAVLRASEAVVDRASEEILARLKSCYAEMLQRDLEGRAHR